MNAIPCPVSRDLNGYQREIDREDVYQARIEAKAIQLRAQYRQDPDMLWESLGNVTARSEANNHPGLIKVFRFGGSENELATAMRYLITLVHAESDDAADQRAEGEVQQEDERIERENALRNFEWRDEL